MTKETMTVHKALAELKILDARIYNTINEATYCKAKKHSANKVNGIEVDEFVKSVQSDYDQTADLINRRKAIKRAVCLSNATTKVNISGGEYTVAEAIEMRNHGVELDKMFLQEMSEQYAEAQKTITDMNGKELEDRADKYVIAIYGQKDGKTNIAEIDKLKNDFLVSNQYEMIDPMNVKEKIKTVQDFVDSFMAEVDSALSCSNALTQITFEY